MIEIIINPNQLELTVSEIEGDAVGVDDGILKSISFI